MTVYASRALAALLALTLSGCAQLPSTPTATLGVPATTLANDTSANHPWRSGWSTFALPGKKLTRYEPGLIDGQPVLRAQSSASASMFRRSLRVPPGELGSVQFSWQVPQAITEADLSDRDREDSPVRVILSFDGNRSSLSAANQMLFELAEALTGEVPPYATLMYVWDNHAALESVIPGGRSDRIRKIVVDAGPHHLGAWRHHQRDVAADFRRAFGEEPGLLTGVAVMTDSDNTRSEATAFYGPLQLIPPPR